MRTIDYKLEIKGERETYTPREEFLNPIINSENKIFEITADNSYGKTFMLNLLAYALDADKLDNEKILTSIKDSIKRYDDKESYDLAYDIQLDLPDNKKLSLTKSSGKNKLIQIDGGPPLSFTSLHKDLAIIYDVPTNPSERLNAVIKDLGVWNNNLITKFSKIFKYTFDITREFDSVRDEEKIKKLEAKIKKIDADIKGVNKVISKKSETLAELNKLSGLNNLSLLLKKKLENESKILKKTKKFKTLKKPQKIEKKDEKKIQELNNELAITNREFKSIISKFINHINDDIEIMDLIVNDVTNKKHYDLIRTTEIKDLLSEDNDLLIINKFNDSVDYIKNALIQFIIQKKNDKSFKIHNSYKQLVDLLEELMENEIDHLLKSATTVESKKLKSSLETIISNHKVKSFDALKDFLNKDLRPLKGFIKQYIVTNNKLVKENKKKQVNNDDSQYYILQGELKDLNDSQKKVINNFNLTSANCANELGITDLTVFDSVVKISDLIFSLKTKIGNSSLTDNLTTSITDLRKDIEKGEKLIKGYKSEKTLASTSCQIEKDKNPSKYNDEQKTRINNFLRLLRLVNNNLGKFNEVISDIEKGDLTKYQDIEDKSFMDLAGSIIAYSMDNKLLRPDGVYIGLKFYNMLKKQFHCEDNIIINKADVSTGLASANYLKQRIDNVEGKYVVVLLDEIGDMSENTMNKVVDSIKNLENQKRLVIALFTRPNSEGIKIIKH